jgi:hypothetical protein
MFGWVLKTAYIAVCVVFRIQQKGFEMKPLYEHDCDNCVLIGQYTDEYYTYDLYVCQKEYEGHDNSELVLRYSDDGPHYFSLSAFGVYMNKALPIRYQAAFVRALQLGLVNVDYLIVMDQALSNNKNPFPYDQ